MPWRVARWAALECRQNDVQGERDQFRGKCAIALGVTCAPADVDADVATLRPPQLLQPLQKRRETDLPCRIVRRDTHQHANAPHPLALLRPRRERPRRSATEKRDEVAPFQLIEFPRFNISGSLAMFDATRLASSIVICFASMASACTSGFGACCGASCGTVRRPRLQLQIADACLLHDKIRRRLLREMLYSRTA